MPAITDGYGTSKTVLCKYAILFIKEKAVRPATFCILKIGNRAFKVLNDERLVIINEVFSLILFER